MEGYPETPSCLLSGTPGPIKVGQTWALIDPEPPLPQSKSRWICYGKRSPRPQIKAKIPVSTSIHPRMLIPKSVSHLFQGINKIKKLVFPLDLKVIFEISTVKLANYMSCIYIFPNQGQIIFFLMVVLLSFWFLVSSKPWAPHSSFCQPITKRFGPYWQSVC